MLDLMLQKADFVGGQFEEAENSVVQFGLGVGKLFREGRHFRPLLFEVWFPVIRDARVLERACRQFETGLQGGAQIA
jgi:hypothetical protein